MADWSQLPEDVLDLIAKRLRSPLYLLRLRSVCSSWRSALPAKPRRLLGRFPYLPSASMYDTSWGFHLSKRTVFLIGCPNSTPRTKPTLDSWLVKVEEDRPWIMHLLHPLSRFQFKPRVEHFPAGKLDLNKFRVFELGQEYVLEYTDYRSWSGAGCLYKEKVAFMYLSYETDDFVLCTIHKSGKLAMFKSGEKLWGIVQEILHFRYVDVMLFRGKFYAVDMKGRTVLVGLSLDLTLIIAGSACGGDKKFLVESGGDLLLVDMYLGIEPVGDSVETTVRFEVFKLDEEEQKWVEVKSLGDDRVLFLGYDCTFSASACDISGLKGNCILFTDNFCYTGNEEVDLLRGRDMGVYDLDIGGVVSFADCLKYFNLFWPPPDWVTFTMWGWDVSI